MNILKKLPLLLSLIKFEHTLFALPFALAAAVVAAHGLPPWSTLGWILLAMVGARSAAMAFNRIVDRKIDAANPRTARRELPAGLVSLRQAKALMGISTLVFIGAAAMLGPLTFILSPVALFIIFGYSYCKRFTSLSHLVLGLALGIAPVGAWIAVRDTLLNSAGAFEAAPFLLAAAVMLWTAGFDILYALQDVEFDKKAGLFSIPKKFGAHKALWIARALHAAAVILLVDFGALCSLSWIYTAGVSVVVGCLIYEHSLVKPTDLSRINAAFFTMNGIVSVVFFVFTLADVWVK